jgi:hypothetical protein
MVVASTSVDPPVSSINLNNYFGSFISMQIDKYLNIFIITLLYNVFICMINLKI